MRTCVLGLGNTILRDDGVGLVVTREVAKEVAARGLTEVEVVEACVAGFDLLELLAGYERAIIVDAVELPGLEPGELVELDPGGPRTSLRLNSVHEVDLATALALGRELGLTMPTEVTAFGIQAVDLRTFGEELTPAVAAAVPGAVAAILSRL